MNLAVNIILLVGKSPIQSMDYIDWIGDDFYKKPIS